MVCIHQMNPTLFCSRNIIIVIVLTTILLPYVIQSQDLVCNTSGSRCNNSTFTISNGTVGCGDCDTLTINCTSGTCIVDCPNEGNCKRIKFNCGAQAKMCLAQCNGQSSCNSLDFTNYGNASMKVICTGLQSCNRVVGPVTCEGPRCSTTASTTKSVSASRTSIASASATSPASASPSLSSIASYSPVHTQMRFNLTCDPDTSKTTICNVLNSISLSQSYLEFNYTVLNVAATFSLDNSSTVILQSDQLIQSNNVTFAGILQITLTSDQIAAINTGMPFALTVFKFNDSRGQFAEVEITNLNAITNCQDTSNSPQYNQISMQVLIQGNGCATDSTHNNDDDNNRAALGVGAIAGIVVGSVCGVLICILVVAGGVFLLVALMKGKSRRDKKLSSVNL